MIASAIKVNVATAMPSENVTELELYPSVTHIKIIIAISTNFIYFFDLRIFPTCVTIQYTGNLYKQE